MTIHDRSRPLYQLPQSREHSVVVTNQCPRFRTTRPKEVLRVVVLQGIEVFKNLRRQWNSYRGSGFCTMHLQHAVLNLPAGQRERIANRETAPARQLNQGSQAGCSIAKTIRVFVDVRRVENRIVLSFSERHRSDLMLAANFSKTERRIVVEIEPLHFFTYPSEEGFDLVLFFLLRGLPLIGPCSTPLLQESRRDFTEGEHALAVCIVTHLFDGAFVCFRSLRCESSLLAIHDVLF